MSKFCEKSHTLLLTIGEKTIGSLEKLTGPLGKRYSMLHFSHEMIGIVNILR